MSDTAPGNRFLDLELQVEVWLADEEIELRRLLTLEPGRTLSLARDPEESVDLVVNGAVVASGDLVVVDGRFGFRVATTAQRKLAELDATAKREAADEVSEPDGGTA